MAGPRPLALVRLLLGLGQVMGATSALYLLIMTGLSGPTLVTAAVTLC
jgi:hypothetical protein